MSDEASPRPWQWWEGQFLIDANAHSVLEPERMSGRLQADMKLIVTAVNHHHELVEALRCLIGEVEDIPPPRRHEHLSLWAVLDGARDLLARIAKERAATVDEGDDRPLCGAAHAASAQGGSYSNLLTSAIPTKPTEAWEREAARERITPSPRIEDEEESK